MSKELPLVSFYMTVKNGIEYIDESINSIKQQTYLNWEAIIVDDGSDDATPKYLEELAKNDLRFNIIYTEGIGRGAALNLAVKSSNGYYLANLDADDLANPNRAKIQVEILEKLKIDFICCEATVIYGKESHNYIVENENIEYHTNIIGNKILHGNPISHIAVMFTRDIFNKAEGYDSNRKTQLDYDLWIRLHKLKIPLYKSNICVGVKRIHDLQSFENKKRLKYILSDFKLKVDAINSLDGEVGLYLLAGANLAYGLLPRHIRNYIRMKRFF